MADGTQQLRDHGFAEENRITRAAARLGIQRPHIYVRATTRRGSSSAKKNVAMMSTKLQASEAVSAFR
jgi:hypothetical protein